jgi:hypothetical protein
MCKKRRITIFVIQMDDNHARSFHPICALAHIFLSYFSAYSIGIFHHESMR